MPELVFDANLRVCGIVSKVMVKIYDNIATNVFPIRSVENFCLSLRRTF